MMSDMSSSETESGASSVAGPEGQVEEGPIASVVPATRSPLSVSRSASLSADSGN